MPSDPNPRGLTFTEAAAKHLEQILPLMHRLRLEDPSLAATRHNEARTCAAAATLIADPRLGRLWIIESENCLAGYLAVAFSHSLEMGGPVAFVDELYVIPEFRRRGIGGGALEFAAEQCGTEGCRSLLLEVSPDNLPAQALYRKRGFAPRGYMLMRREL
jgi:ribosomal protein S18 acetylase RimI-like enzyme